jgi:T5orf172 domain
MDPHVLADPSDTLSAHALTDLRRALSDNNSEAAQEAVVAFRRAGGHVHLASYLNGRTVERPGIGYIYVLSTREQPRILKIGYTDRSVEERVKEINRATGVVIPYGVRAVWAVQHAQTVEAELHARLAAYRIRKDREFFNIDFRDAFPIIRDYVQAARREK